MAMSKQKLTLIGCGGGGTNLVMSYMRRPNNLVGQADTRGYIVDTSFSNAAEVGNFGDREKMDLYIFDDVNGAGKERVALAKVVPPRIPSIVAEMPIGDFNIVVFSLSGGSGSVIGPCIVRQLLDQNKPVVALVIGSSESAITATNTLATLRTLAKQSTLAEKPLIIRYFENNGPRANTDEEVLSTITSLSILFSGENTEMDYTDLKNFLNFSNVTSCAPEIATLEIFTDLETLAGETKYPIALATLSTVPSYDETENTKAGVLPDYYCNGFAQVDPKLVTTERLHFAITVDSLEDMVKHVQSVATAATKHRDARRGTPSFLTGNEEADDDGMIY